MLEIYIIIVILVVEVINSIAALFTKCTDSTTTLVTTLMLLDGIIYYVICYFIVTITILCVVQHNAYCRGRRVLCNTCLNIGRKTGHFLFRMDFRTF